MERQVHFQRLKMDLPCVDFLVCTQRSAGPLVAVDYKCSLTGDEEGKSPRKIPSALQPTPQSPEPVVMVVLWRDKPAVLRFLQDGGVLWLAAKWRWLATKWHPRIASPEISADTLRTARKATVLAMKAVITQGKGSVLPVHECGRQRVLKILAGGSVPKDGMHEVGVGAMLPSG